MLYEISRRFIHINKHEETSSWWHNSVLTIQTNKNLALFDYVYNVNSVEKKIICTESTINCSKSSPISPKFLQSFVKRGVKNIELVEMITDPCLRPHSIMLMQEMAHIRSFQWSPDNIILNHQKLLAVVNSCGNVDLYAFKRCGWTNVMNFSNIINKHLNSPDSIEEIPKDFDEIKAVAYSLSTSAVCWFSDVNNSCFFVTAQKSGQIIFWNIKCDFLEIQSLFCGSFQGYAVELQAMFWVPIHTNRFILFCSNILGQIVGYECIIDNGIQLIREHSIWMHEDKMITKYLQFYKHDDKIIIMYNKHRHLLVQMYDSELNLLSQAITPVNDHRITSITKSNDEFYLTTINTKIFKINYNIINNTINVSLNCVEIKDTFSSYELYGLGISQNSALFALITIDRKVQFRKDMLKIEIVFLSRKNCFENEINAIISNPTKKLYFMWDHLEIVRYKTLKTKKLPDIGFDKLLTDGNSDIYKLKVYLIFLKLSANIKLTKAINICNSLSQNSIEVVQEKIFSLQACTLLNNIYKDSLIGELNNFRIECYIGGKKYLEYYCKKYKTDVREIISEEVFSLYDSNTDYICQCCDEKIEGYTCRLGHLNVFCSLTFTPINSNDYLICKNCELTVRSELYDQKPSCLLCDSYLNFYDMT